MKDKFIFIVFLVPVIQEYFASEEHKSGKPPEGKVFPEPPVKLDTTTQVTPPATLAAFMSSVKPDSISPLFEKGELKVEVVKAAAKYGPSQTKPGLETFIWVLAGAGKARIISPTGVEVDNLKAQDSLLVTEKCEFSLEGDGQDFLALIINMDPLANKS